MTAHDAHFKLLLRTFFVEFLEAFVPELARGLRPKSVVFQDKELIRTRRSRRVSRMVDLVARVNFSDEAGYVLVHVEHQAQAQGGIGRRLWLYATWLYEQTGLPVYPILLTSYAEPKRTEPDRFVLTVRGLEVIEFRYRVVQLNHLNWREYLRSDNPAATALMARMKIAPADRPRVKLQIFRLLLRLQLDRDKMDLVAGFVDTYLRLNPREELVFCRHLESLEQKAEKERVMKLMTRWERKGQKNGRAEGRVEGRVEGQRVLLRQLVQCRLGEIPANIDHQIQRLGFPQIETLAKALLDLKSVEELNRWLAAQNRLGTSPLRGA